MANCDPELYPLTNDLQKNSRWSNIDKFPGNIGCDFYEKLLGFASDREWFANCVADIRSASSPKHRNSLLAELAAAWFFETKRKLPIESWKPRGAGKKEGEFTLRIPERGHVFVEVKGPSWEQEFARDSGPLSEAVLARLKNPKYQYQSEEAWIPDPEFSIRRAVENTVAKLPADAPTLLVIFDDLRVSPSEMNLDDLRCEIYEPAQPGLKTTDGVFCSAKFSGLGGLGIMGYGPSSNPGNFVFHLFSNPFASTQSRISEDWFTAS